MKQYTGVEYLKIDIATQFGNGLDKVLFEERIEWVDANEAKLEEIEDLAEDYYRYAAAVLAYRTTQKGEATGHMVGLDACASGPCILSVITGCKVGAANTGATGQTRKDVYTINTDTMNEIMGTDKTYKRSDVKDAFMPHFYGSVEEPKKVFGEDTKELQAFYEATYRVCPGASMLLDVIDDLWDPNAFEYCWNLPDGHSVVSKVKTQIKPKIHIDTLIGEPTFIYQHDVNTPTEKGRFLHANVTHSIDGYIVRELTARCDYNAGQLRSAEILLLRRLQKNITSREGVMLYAEQMWHKHKALSIEGIECINTWSINEMGKEYCEALLVLVRELLRRPAFKVTTIHDEFKCHPNYMNWVRQTYIDLLAELAESNVLDDILSDVAQKEMSIEKLSTDLADDIRKAEYPLS